MRDKPVIIVAVAGGSGGGSEQCIEHMTQPLSHSGMRVVDAVPVRRQNLQSKIDQLRAAGASLVLRRYA